jgi:hypothetical protein
VTVKDIKTKLVLNIYRINKKLHDFSEEENIVEKEIIFDNSDVGKVKYYTVNEKRKEYLFYMKLEIILINIKLILRDLKRPDFFTKERRSRKNKHSKNSTKNLCENIPTDNTRKTISTKCNSMLDESITFPNTSTDSIDNGYINKIEQEVINHKLRQIKIEELKHVLSDIFKTEQNFDEKMLSELEFELYKLIGFIYN